MSDVGERIPATERWFDDYRPGEVIEAGEASVTEADLLEFARRYDPQPMHTDREAAASGPFGGLIASGWHTTALAMRLLVDHFLPRAAGLVSPGIDELRWLRPVRPGDRLRVRVTVIEATRSRSRPDRGMIRSRVEVLNQAGETVMSLVAMNLMRARPTPAG